MEKDQIIILKNRGLLSITGDDAKEFLQNLITNDINKVSKKNSIFAALLSPQGKYLFDFFVIKTIGGYLLDCDGNSVNGSIDFGSSTKRWNNIFTSDLDLSNEAKGVNDIDGTWGHYTIVEGESDLFLKNNRSGKTYKFNLTEVS